MHTNMIKDNNVQVSIWYEYAHILEKQNLIQILQHT